MTKTELLELIASGENSGVEFKRDELRPEKLAKEVVALANLRGGQILLGVEDDGTISGINRDDLEHWVVDTVFKRYVHPVIDPFYQEVKFGDGKRVAVVSLTEGAAKPYVVRSSGREEIYIRMGSTSQLATREQQGRLHQNGGLFQAEQLSISGSKLADLSELRLAVHLKSILRDRVLPRTADEWHERLCMLGFMVECPTGPPVCTIAGLVLFGRSPRRHLRYGGVRLMAIDGGRINDRAIFDERIDGPLIALHREESDKSFTVIEPGIVESLVNNMRPILSHESESIDESFRRSRAWYYPLEAMREAVINALAHRDWTRVEEAQVIRFADRLEFVSPGALHNSMTVDKMVAGRRSARNPLISEVLQYYGYVDARGMGVRNTIVPLVRELNGVEPKFEATADDLRVTMYRKPPK